MADAHPLKRPLAVASSQVDNDRFIVTEWRFAPGAHTGWHRHQYDYVVVPMNTGQLRLETAEGPVVAELKAGVAYARQAGVEHNVVNDSEVEFVFVEIEVRSSL